ncbi:MAG: hypothetical protein JO348_00690 [Alphaproteobacteria bacterium]|nr:hypothetical protein [Alphaproteobacteria bacterium]MBV9418263.1 hypothetical protein [Alphaproteobacteria bacterium]MBV9540959.1 hypothetical protein [Alphaproteobacteria bacterium]MBV9905049.1 hypothetical protein [Alphaproteobacteria bacterium]
MTKKTIALAALAAMLGTAAPAMAAPMVCLNTYQIDRTHVVDSQNILFKMRNGKVWRSHLRTPCLGLKFSGFAYQTSFTEICGGVQTIHILDSGEACQLGNFTPEKA